MALARAQVVAPVVVVKRVALMEAVRVLAGRATMVAQAQARAEQGAAARTVLE
jgi:hypothetical protein